MNLVQCQGNYEGLALSFLTKQPVRNDMYLIYQNLRDMARVSRVPP